MMKECKNLNFQLFKVGFGQGRIKLIKTKIDELFKNQNILIVASSRSVINIFTDFMINNLINWLSYKLTLNFNPS